MADLGLYFGDEDEEQLEQEDKALSYLVLASDQDDAFDPIDTENLLAQMSAGSLISHRMELDEETDVVQLLSEPNLTPLEKAELLSQSQYHFHRSFLAREITTLLPQMDTRQAIRHVIPILKEFSLDTMDAVREALAAQLDKIVLYFFNNTVIDHDLKEVSEDEEEADDENPFGGEYPAQKHPIPHGTFTPIFMNLLLDQVSGIAHQTRIAVVSVSENVPEETMESEMLNGVIAGLEKLYNRDETEKQEEIEEIHQIQDEFTGYTTTAKEEDERICELAKMLVVVLLTSQAKLLGPERCTKIVIPTLERFMSHSEFYVRKVSKNFDIRKNDNGRCSAESASSTVKTGTGLPSVNGKKFTDRVGQKLVSLFTKQEIVMALGTICSIVDESVVVNQLLPIYDTFVQDDTWHIRRACCTILPSLIASLPNEMKAKKVEEVYQTFSTDVSYSVRNSMMEVLGEVIAKFEQDHVPDSLLTHFLNMGQHPINEYERAVMCAFSFPAVILTAGRSKWEVMKPVYLRLAGAFRAPIRRSLACSLHEVARILGPELAGRDLAVAFSDCLVAEDEVKEGVLGHVVEFLTSLSPEYQSKALLELHHAWSDLERSSNWRLRDSLAGHLSALCEISEAGDLVKFLMPLCVKACTDSVSTIRESGVMTFPALWEASDRVGPVPVLEEDHAEESIKEDATLSPTGAEQEDVEMQDMTGDNLAAPESTAQNTDEETPVVPSSPKVTKITTVKEQVILQTAEFGIHGTFRSRVVAVQIIQALLDHGITTTEFEEHFMPVLIDYLAVDTVVNVRIWAARVVNWIFENGFYGDAPVCEPIQGLLTRLQQDPDRDVRIYSGGPAELAPPKRKKKKSKSNKAASTSDTKSKKKVSPVFHQNPKHGEAATMEEEVDMDEDEHDGEGDQVEVRLLYQKDEDESSEEEDDDDSSSEESSEEEEETIATSTKFAKTSWDDVPDAENEDIELEDRSTDVVPTLPPRSILDDDDEEEEQEEGIADRVVPYTTLNASGASPLDVEMEEPTTTTSASVDLTSPPSPSHSESAFPLLSSSATTTTAAQVPPPLTSPVVSYAGTVKFGGDAKAKLHLASSLSSLTSFSQANIPEPSVPSASDTTTVVSAVVSGSTVDAVDCEKDESDDEDEVVFQGRRQWIGRPNGNSHQINQSTELLTSFPSLTSPPSSSSSSSSSASAAAAVAVAAAAATSSLPFSYASVVASGAPLHSAFSHHQPLPPAVIASSSSALDYSF